MPEGPIFINFSAIFKTGIPSYSLGDPEQEPPIGYTINRMWREACLDQLGPNLPLPADLSSCFKGAENPIDVRA